MEKVHGHGLLAFSRGTSVAEARFCCAKIAPQGSRRNAACGARIVLSLFSPSSSISEIPHCFEVSFAYMYLKVDWVGSRDSGRVVREGEREGGDHRQLINCLCMCVCVFVCVCVCACVCAKVCV